MDEREISNQLNFWYDQFYCFFLSHSYENIFDIEIILDDKLDGFERGLSELIYQLWAFTQDSIIHLRKDPTEYIKNNFKVEIKLFYEEDMKIISIKKID